MKNINLKRFNLLSRINEARFLLQHESCGCKCRLNQNTCKIKHKWNLNIWRYEYKEPINWGSCNKIYMWNPCKCDCELDETCEMGEYLDIRNCAYKERVIDNLMLTCDDEILYTTERTLKNSVSIKQ